MELKGESDPFWGPISEYIHVIEETMISEGQKNTLDNEIVEKTLSLLARVGRLIPQLKELNDANMNHNIQRLIFKDLNGAINPFLKLGGEAKRLNRRLLLTGIKDINSKLSAYVETIEQKISLNCKLVWNSSNNAIVLKNKEELTMTTQLVQLKSADLQKVEQEAKQMLQKVSTTDDLELEGLMDSIGRMGAKTMEQAVNL